jgi:hypothetical protein
MSDCRCLLRLRLKKPPTSRYLWDEGLTAGMSIGFGWRQAGSVTSYS